MKSMLKNAAILLIITVIAGFVLGLVYQNTKELIADREVQEKKEACLEVFHNASDFKPIENVVTEDIRKKLDENGFENETIEEGAMAVDGNEQLLGYVLTIKTSQGYAGDIRFTVGIQNDGTVNGISILSISETAGLGMQADAVLKPQFANKKVQSFEYTKTGATSENQIDAISGATITTNAITTGVNCGLYYFQTFLGGGNINE